MNGIIQFVIFQNWIFFITQNNFLEIHSSQSLYVLWLVGIHVG